MAGDISSIVRFKRCKNEARTAMKTNNQIKPNEKKLDNFGSELAPSSRRSKHYCLDSVVYLFFLLFFSSFEDKNKQTTTAADPYTNEKGEIRLPKRNSAVTRIGNLLRHIILTKTHRPIYNFYEILCDQSLTSVQSIARIEIVSFM
jgi:hypothetical protein